MLTQKIALAYVAGKSKSTPPGAALSQCLDCFLLDTVLKQISFVYTSCIGVPVRTALNFGKQAVPFQYYNLTFDIYTIYMQRKNIFTFC